jgi:hypothetical protein
MCWISRLGFLSYIHLFWSVLVASWVYNVLAKNVSCYLKCWDRKFAIYGHECLIKLIGTDAVVVSRIPV